MSLFDRFIVWLAVAIKPKPKQDFPLHGKQISRVHRVQLKRQKANQRLFYQSRTGKF